jgi:hypothetical protein
MKVYTDNEFKCHTSNPDGTYREFEVGFFDGKCQAFIEGHRYCPKGERYVRDDGEVFYGECITPWKPSDELDAVQLKYEQKLLADAENALAILLGGTV